DGGDHPRAGRAQLSLPHRRRLHVSFEERELADFRIVFRTIVCGPVFDRGGLPALAREARYVGCVPYPPKGHRTVALLHPRHALGRISLALALGAAAGLLLSLRYPTLLATVGGWDVGGLALL